MLGVLMRASLDGAIVVAVVWTLVRLLPRLSAATRTFLWWCAAAKFVVALVWVAPVPVRILPPADSRIPNAATAVGRTTVESLQLTAPSAVGGAREPDVRTAAQRGWSVSLVAIWATGFLLAAGIALRRWRQTVGVVRRSVVASGANQTMAADLASRLGLRRVPHVRLSDQLETPLVTGLARPVILLPTNRFDVMSDRQQRMALCHELAHIKRADLWLGCMPALAERVFFFHPLVHLAAREYALWREAACDAIVLEALDAAPQEYARLLIDLGVSQRRTSLAAAGASWSFVNLKRRLVMLRDPSTPSTASRLLVATAVGVSLLAIVPMQLAARPAPRVTAVENAPQSAATSLANATLDPRTALTDANVWRDLAPLEEPGQRKERDLNFVLFFDDHHTTMSGSMQDIERARRFKRPGERVMWFRQAGREFVVRDPAVLRQVEAIWIPVNVLGDQQGKVGGRQGELGTKQGELGTKQGEIGTAQGRLGTRQGRLGTRLGVLATQEGSRTLTAAERDAFDKERREIDREMRELDREMRLLEAKIREFDEPMRDLDDQMQVLSKEMDVLSAQMEEAVRKAEAEMRVLLERAIASGVAEAVK